MSGFGRKHDYVAINTCDSRSAILDAVNKVARIPALLEAIEAPHSRPTKEVVLKDIVAWEKYANDLQRFIAFVKKEEEKKLDPERWIERRMHVLVDNKLADVMCDSRDCPCKANPLITDVWGKRKWVGLYYHKPATNANLCDCCYTNMMCNDM